MVYDILGQCIVPKKFNEYVTDKSLSTRHYFIYFLSRVQQMFTYKNLPDTIPHEMLDRYLFMNGIACITEVDGKLYVFNGNLGGEYDVYYRPTLFVVANPHIRQEFTKEVVVLGDSEHTGVLMRNDTEWNGLTPLISRYAYLLAENSLTIRTAQIMLRVTALLTAPTDDDKKAADQYLKNLESGKLSSVGESGFFDGIRLQSPPSNNGSYLTQFIEMQQYLTGSFYNEIGLKANYNMKREAIGQGESTLDDDALLPLADNMLLCRREDLQKVNDMYGTNIEVDFSSSWKERRLANEITLVSSASQLAGGEAASALQENDSNQIQNDSDQIQNDSDQIQNDSDQIQKETDLSQNDDTEGISLDDVASQLVSELGEYLECEESDDVGKSESEGQNESE